MNIIEFSIKNIVKESYRIAEENLWKVVGTFSIVFFSGMFLSILSGNAHILSLASSALFSFVSIMFGLSYSKGEHFKFEKILEDFDFKNFLFFFFASIATTVLVFVGLILLVIPGFIAMTALVFVPYLIVDKRLNTIDAIKESFRITKGNRWKIFLMMLVFLFVNILGMLFFGVGLLFTIPLTLISFSMLYNKFTNQ